MSGEGAPHGGGGGGVGRPERGEEVLAWVGDEPVTRDELERFLRAIAPSVVGARIGVDIDAGLGTSTRSASVSGDGDGDDELGQSHGAARALREQWALKALVRQRLLDAERRRGGHADVRALLGAVADGAAGEPTTGEVETYYRRSPELFAVAEARRVTHVLCRDEAAARAVIARVEAGEPLERLAAAHSLDRGSRRSGGDLGEVRRGELAGALEDAIFSARPGAVVGPVRSCFGWHVLRVEAVVPARQAPLDEVRSGIEQHLREAMRGQVAGSWLEARIRSEARVARGFEHPSRHGLPGSAHRH